MNPDLASSIAAPGTVIAGKYRVERTLGEGGMGVVVEAMHLALGHRVAVKLLRAEVAQAPECKARFLREARVAARLPPEHVVQVFDVGETKEGVPYLVMELLTGRDLAQDLAMRGPLPIQEAVDYVLQACEGIAEAHAVGLVHRDLKPANLFLAARRGTPPVVKVLDFGLSKMFDAAGQPTLTQTTSNFGTPAYMSPEQIRSAKYVDPRSDQHALAMILYELITGRPPYDAESLTGLMVVISTAPPPSAREARPEVPEELDAAIQRGMAKQQAARFPSLSEFAFALAPFGGPKAWASAKQVLTSLASTASGDAEAEDGPAQIPTVPTPPGEAQEHPAAAGELPAVSAPPNEPPAVPAPPNELHASRETPAPTTSDPQVLARSARRPVLVLVGAACVLTLFGIAMVMRGVLSGDAETEPAPAPATAEALVPSGAPDPGPTTTAEGAPAIVPASSSAAEHAAQPPATSSGSSKVKRPPGPAPTPSSTAKPQTARDVFGGG
jgi:serine/threonine-protein kinase